MKNYLILLLLLLPATLLAQNTTKFTATAIAFRYQENDNWQDWGEWEKDIEILTSITLYDDESNYYGKIKIYSKKTQIYDLISIEETEETDIHYTSTYFSEDIDGINCSIKLSLSKSTKITQLYVMYNNMQCVYNLIKNK